MRFPLGTRVQVNAPSYPHAHGLVGVVAEYDGTTTPYRVLFGIIETAVIGMLADVIAMKPIEDDGWYTEAELSEVLATTTPPPTK